MARKMTDAERIALKKRRKTIQWLSTLIGVVLALWTISLIIDGSRAIQQNSNAQHAVPSSQSSHTETAQNNTSIGSPKNSNAEESKIEKRSSDESSN